MRQLYQSAQKLKLGSFKGTSLCPLNIQGIGVPAPPNLTLDPNLAFRAESKSVFAISDDHSPQSSSSWGASCTLSAPVTSSSDPQSVQVMISPSSASAGRLISAPHMGHSAISIPRIKVCSVQLKYINLYNKKKPTFCQRAVSSEREKHLFDPKLIKLVSVRCGSMFPIRQLSVESGPFPAITPPCHF